MKIRYVGVVLTLCFVASMGVMVVPAFAEDGEHPITIPSVSGNAATFGTSDIGVQDVGGPAIDVKDIIEPAVTALLVTGDADEPSSGSLTVATQPVFEFVAE